MWKIGASGRDWNPVVAKLQLTNKQTKQLSSTAPTIIFVFLACTQWTSLHLSVCGIQISLSLLKSWWTPLGNRSLANTSRTASLTTSSTTPNCDTRQWTRQRPSIRPEANGSALLCVLVLLEIHPCDRIFILQCSNGCYYVELLHGRVHNIARLMAESPSQNIFSPFRAFVPSAVCLAQGMIITIALYCRANSDRYALYFFSSWYYHWTNYATCRAWTQNGETCCSQCIFEGSIASTNDTFQWCHQTPHPQGGIANCWIK